MYSTSLTGRFSRTINRTLLATAVAVVLLGGAVPALAQDDPNTGGLTVAAGLDVPSLYYFRGYRQEVDPGLTMFPYVDLGFGLQSGEGSLKSATVNLGVWNSLNTGSSGGDEDKGGPGGLHYEEDFYATLGLGFGGGISVGTTWTAYTSPNGMFATIQEIMVKVSKAHKFAPYGLVAFEVADDGGDKGTYAEFGAGPSFPLGGGGATLTVPAKIGLGLSDYYFDPDTGESSTFGFFSVGGTVAFPLSGPEARFGSWSLKGGVEFLMLGDGPQSGNISSFDDEDPSSTGVVVFFGVGFSY